MTEPLTCLDRLESKIYFFRAQMIEPQTEQTRRESGFHVKEQARRYRTRMDI